MKYLFLLFLFSTQVLFSQQDSPHTKIQLPIDSDTTNDFIIERPQYVISYNLSLNVANWASWELDSSSYGSIQRFEDGFLTETKLPKKAKRVSSSSYNYSGFDRGHLVRSEERTASVKDNRATFYMSNIVPQTPDLNRGVWYDFEKWCEKMCKDSSKVLYVIAGGIYKSGKKVNNLISIPDSCYKIVVVVSPGEEVTKDTRVEAVIIPNVQGIKFDKWKKYKCTVNDIEISTGFSFLNKLPKTIQVELKRK